MLSLDFILSFVYALIISQSMSKRIIHWTQGPTPTYIQIENGLSDVTCSIQLGCKEFEVHN